MNKRKIKKRIIKYLKNCKNFKVTSNRIILLRYYDLGSYCMIKLSCDNSPLSNTVMTTWDNNEILSYFC